VRDNERKAFALSSKVKLHGRDKLAARKLLHFCGEIENRRPSVID
jgi:hypothetical protein